MRTILMKSVRKLEKGGWGIDDKKSNRGVNMIEIYACMKYHNKTPHFLQLIYSNKIIL
jgi:hypothetical protein